MVRRQHGNSQEHVTKHIFVTGGVVSSLGKGLTASSLGRLLRSRGIKVLQQKLDPYINVDPGTMNPFQHGEVYVTEDGAETDLDIGHYERFLDVYLSQKANVTTGQIYQEVLRKERAGEYLGQCVQVIPHITNEIKSRMRAQASDDVDVIITEIGGTVGDIESQPFLEAAREVRRDLGAENCMFVHVSLVPYIAAAHELKTKPTQHSVMMLRQLGISPDALVLRSDRPLNQSIKDKISLMCDVDSEGVVNCVDAPSIYDVPKTLFDEGLDAYVVRELGLPFHDVDWDEWEDLLERVHHPKHEVNVAIVGKYIDLPDAYLSVTEAIKAGGFANWAKVNVKWVAADKCATEEGAAAALDQVDGIVIPAASASVASTARSAPCVTPASTSCRPSACASVCSPWSSNTHAMSSASPTRTPPNSIRIAPTRSSPPWKSRRTSSPARATWVTPCVWAPTRRNWRKAPLSPSCTAPRMSPNATATVTR